MKMSRKERRAEQRRDVIAPAPASAPHPVMRDTIAPALVKPAAGSLTVLSRRYNEAGELVSEQM